MSKPAQCRRTGRERTINQSAGFRMEVHQLRYFAAVARQGTFTRAAESEHVAQPSLSQQILKLEAELGARLFDRLPRAARLTIFGATFLPKAERILRELGDAKTEMQEMAGDEKGDLALGIIPTIAPYLMPALIARFTTEHPLIRLRVLEEITPALLERLHQGLLDLAIVALPVPGSGAKLDCDQLFAERLLAALPENHPRAAQKTVRLADLNRESFLLLKEGHCFRDTMIAACRSARMRPNVVFESGQFATILAMVAAGMGVSAVPEMAAQPVPGCRFVAIEGRQNLRRIGIVRLRHHYESCAQRAFLNHVIRHHGQARHANADACAHGVGAAQLRPAKQGNIR
ncbi:MAG: LysR family transcriptional regulator [Acetobacteraceae bacterium]